MYLVCLPEGVFVRRLDNIDLRLLRVFATLVEAGSFADAQIALNLSQPTLSTHLATAIEKPPRTAADNVV
jgi:hypothetical protein